MKSDIFVIAPSAEQAQPMLAKYPTFKLIVSHELDLQALTRILKKTFTKHFYVIDYRVDPCDVDFGYKPDDWENGYVHMFNYEPMVRIFNRLLVKQDPEKYTDESYYAGKIKTHNHNSKPYTMWDKSFDVVFLSYDEPTADENYKKLLGHYPNAKRVHGVTGIFDAHKACAEIATTSMFFVVDADAILVDDFTLNVDPNNYCLDSVYVWRSKNPVNGLEYGYGGVKLFPRDGVLNASEWKIDFTTSVAKRFRPVMEVSNITAFNVSEFDAWKSGFREAAKLSSAVIKNANVDSQERLDIWCTVNNGAEYGEATVKGAKLGRFYGTEHINDVDMLSNINDFKWLREQYDKAYVM